MAAEQILQLEEDAFLFLDNLRESGVTNMYGATPYLLAEFGDEGLIKRDARQLLAKWMETFSERHS